MVKLLKPYWKLIALLLLATLLSNSINLLLPKIISESINMFSSGRITLKPVVLKFSIAVFMILIFSASQSVLQAYISELAAMNLRNKLSAKISLQTYSYVQAADPSRLLTNLTADVDAIKLFISQSIASIFSAVIIIIGSAVFLLTINWKLGICVLLVLPMVAITFYLIIGKAKTLFTEGRSIMDRLNKVIQENIIGSALIRIVNSQNIEYDKFLKANTAFKRLGFSTLRLMAIIIPLITFIANSGVVIILAFGGHLVIKGEMKLGDLAAFNSYLTMLIFPVMIIGFTSNVIAQATASYARISEILDALELPAEGSIIPRIKDDIEFKNVSLFYKQTPVLKNISFKIGAGTKTAVIGPTAAGKSQLLHLLTGLISPNSGTVLFGNLPIDQHLNDFFYRQIGFVFQDSVLFNMSIRENIAFGNSVNDEALNKAIETACLKDFINGLPAKLDTVISERGSNLSGGQKQRMMLARALALNPRLLLLDDFTARLDAATEKNIMENIQKNYVDLTIITVTQKIIDTDKYDQIILIMQGEVIAIGRHTDLLDYCPEYVQFFNSQQSTRNYEL